MTEDTNIKCANFTKWLKDLTPTYSTSLVPSTVENTLQIIYETLKTLDLYLKEHSYIIYHFYHHALENMMKIPLIFEIEPLSQVLNKS